MVSVTIHMSASFPVTENCIRADNSLVILGTIELLLDAKVRKAAQNCAFGYTSLTILMARTVQDVADGMCMADKYIIIVLKTICELELIAKYVKPSYVRIRSTLSSMSCVIEGVKLNVWICISLHEELLPVCTFVLSSIVEHSF
uniref:3-methyl-2-oxobutanoate hydroxymethyltransferase n=1 Tax=Angiostrongylus cantonensis TaxID=6313 RepID=A0A0K0DJ96_ANGCA